MSETGASPIDLGIGTVSDPPFVRLPEPADLFAVRSGRFAELAQSHQLAPYLRFLGALCAVQHQIQDGLPVPDMPGPDVLAQAKTHAMPPLDRGRFTTDAAFDRTLERLLSLAATVEMPAPAQGALTRLSEADAGTRAQMIHAVLHDAVPVEAIAEHVFVAAALQVHFSRMAARLDPKSLVEVGDGACPACGGPPVASQIVGWAGAQNSRFCTCSLCQTQWNYVRIKCTLCGTTQNIGYQHVEQDKQIRAETCESCKAYVKVLQQVQNPALDPVADDVASLGLDLLVRDLGYRRGAVNPFMLGY